MIESLKQQLKSVGVEDDASKCQLLCDEQSTQHFSHGESFKCSGESL